MNLRAATMQRPVNSAPIQLEWPPRLGSQVDTRYSSGRFRVHAWRPRGSNHKSAAWPCPSARGLPYSLSVTLCHRMRTMQATCYWHPASRTGYVVYMVLHMISDFYSADDEQGNVSLSHVVAVLDRLLALCITMDESISSVIADIELLRCLSQPTSNRPRYVCMCHAWFKQDAFLIVLRSNCLKLLDAARARPAMLTQRSLTFC